MRALFPGGIEETRDARGRLELAAYAAPPLTLPADLGPWRIDPVEDARARVWREDHHGTLIGNRLWVGPPSERPLDGRLAVVIEQGHAFGSGAHATTTGCLELLCELDGTGSVLDLGCGSGVLAIAAALLGNRPVYACDVDPLAVSATRENVRANHVDVAVFEADAASDDLPEADLWVANLASGPLTDVLARPDAPGRAIVSGLYADDLPRMSGWHIEREVERAGWHALARDPALKTAILDDVRPRGPVPEGLAVDVEAEPEVVRQERDPVRRSREQAADHAHDRPCRGSRARPCASTRRAAHRGRRTCRGAASPGSVRAARRAATTRASRRRASRWQAGCRAGRHRGVGRAGDDRGAGYLASVRLPPLGLLLTGAAPWRGRPSSRRST